MRKIAFAAALAGALISACQPTPETTPDDPKAGPPPPLKDIAGLLPAVDLDPAANAVEYELTIGVNSQELVPGQMTEMWTFNGTSPGPLLQARVGDLVKIHVTNTLNEPTTVHWHGLRIDYRMDGVVAGELVAIQPGETFTYEFTVPDAGTYWYHPHVRSSVQVEAGLYGAFVVEEQPEDLPEVDADRIMVIDDIRLNDDGSIAPHQTAGPDIMHGRQGNVLILNGDAEAEPLAYGHGRVERWRLVNTSNARTFYFEFPGLEVREIGADAGLWPQRMTRGITRLKLPVGARAELEVRMPAGSTAGSLDAMVLAQTASGNIVEQPYPVIDVVYDADLDVDEPKAGHTWDAPFDAISTDVEVTHEIRLGVANGAFSINGANYPNVAPWNVPQGELQVIKIVNEIGPEHPFHLHGQFFQVLKREGFIAEKSGWRDSVLLDGMSTITIATYMDNPGHWMYHCHILEHAEAGMMALMTVEAD
jgi:FtsP/CotA-like multicopper oxidase with cupredoxin domain